MARKSGKKKNTQVVIVEPRAMIRYPRLMEVLNFSEDHILYVTIKQIPK